MPKPRWPLVAVAATAVVAGLLIVVFIVLAPLAPGRAPSELPTMADEVADVPLDVAAGSNIDSMADRAWLTETAEATGIPVRALQGYAGAIVAMQLLLPDCNLGWNTLAAIGYVESRHGTYDGSVMDADGLVSPPIVGPPLDGELFDAIEDSDGGALDGDTTWDRAVGPMQFLPSLWADGGRDGDTNGETNVNDIDDASYTAMLYLCADGGDLSDPDAWRYGIGTYNSSTSYLIAVAKAANEYAAAVAVPSPSASPTP